MFICQFCDGRPAAAPKLKRAAPEAGVSKPGDGAGDQVATIIEGLLPHLHNDKSIKKDFPAATPLPQGTNCVTQSFDFLATESRQGSTELERVKQARARGSRADR